jgi:L-fucose mutarotase/ribose pyranase (RbsD/FucU family)
MKKQYLKDLAGLEGRKVRVYRNLTDKCFSVRCLKTNRVIAHVLDIILTDATFPVGQEQRREVIRSGHKNVHAFVQGYISL